MHLCIWQGLVTDNKSHSGSFNQEEIEYKESEVSQIIGRAGGADFNLGLQAHFLECIVLSFKEVTKLAIYKL